MLTQCSARRWKLEDAAAQIAAPAGVDATAALQAQRTEAAVRSASMCQKVGLVHIA